MGYFSITRVTNILNFEDFFICFDLSMMNGKRLSNFDLSEMNGKRLSNQIKCSWWMSLCLFRGPRQKTFEFFIGIGPISLRPPPPPWSYRPKFFKTKFSLFETTVFFNRIRGIRPRFLPPVFLLTCLSFDYLTHIEFVYNTRVDVEN